MAIPRSITLGVVMLVTACGTGSTGTVARSTTPLAPTARDSAGVKILEHTADALDRAPLLALDSTPVATIGKGESDLDLSRVGSALVLHDGSIAFSTQGVVHLYSPDGRAHQRIGRQGQGPNEFQDADLAWGKGDTILVTDSRNSRLSWIVPAKGVVRMRAVKLDYPGVGFGAIGQGPGDTLIMATTNFYPQSAEAGHGTPFPVGVLGAADSVHILVPLEGGELRTVPELAGNGMGGVAAVRYPPMPQAAWWGDGFLAVRPDHWHLDRYRPAGGLIASVRIPVRRVPFTKQLREQDIAGTIAMWKARPGAPPDTSSTYKIFQYFPYPDSMPSFGNTVTTPGGIAWVRDQRLSADTTWGYTAVAADGRLLGRLLGHGRTPVAFGDDRVVLRDEDADGVVTWRVMKVEWSDEAPSH